MSSRTAGQKRAAPSLKFDAPSSLSTPDGQTANDECGICLETLTAAVTLPCKHKFCASCLDGRKSKFGSSVQNKKERSKSCPLCREKIPPSKDIMIQLDCYRAQKRWLEEKGETTADYYMSIVEQVERLEAEIGDYEGEGLNYDTVKFIELPKYIYDAVVANNIKSILKWLGSPVDKKKLSARYSGTYYELHSTTLGCFY